MNEITNEIMENKEIIDTIIEVAPAVTKPKANWRKFGVGALVVGVIGTLAAGAYYVIKKFNKDEAQDETIDNVKVAEHDFADEDQDEE